MKLFNHRGVVQKIIIALIIVILVNFTIPIKSQADFGGTLFEPITQLVANIGDVVLGILQKFMLGTKYAYSSIMLEKENPTVTDGYISQTDGKNIDVTVDRDDLDGKLFGNAIKYPNILYCPENIFGNKIAALDVNFVNPNEYTSVTENLESAENAAQSVANSSLRNTVATWYKAFRNIAIVGLLSVLVYIGIRILLGSTAQDKAKYKERLTDWLVGLCLVFVMHYIMSGTMMVIENVTQLLSQSMDTEYIIKIDNPESGEPGTIATNLMGYVRFMAQHDDLGDAAGYTIMYVVLVVYTVMFTFTYLKRVLYMAFFTMISPLVALTYPIDKMADGKAQGFSMWFKEYIMNALIQPVHLVLYFTLVGSAAELAKNNLIYSLVAIAFLLPAEKFIKKLFRLDRAETPGGLGSFAGGALAMQGLQKLGNMGTKIGKKEASSGKNAGNDKIRTQDQKQIGKSDTKDFNAWKNGEEENANLPHETQKPENLDSTNEPSLLDEESSTTAPLPQQGEDISTNINDNSATTPLPQQEDDYFTGTNNNNSQIDAENIQKDNNDTKISGLNSNVKPEPRKHYRGKIAWRAVKSAGKTVWKNKGKMGRGVVKFVGTGTGAMIGAAAGLATGDVSKSLAYVTTGALAGRAIGNNTANLAGGVTSGIKTIGGKAIDTTHNAQNAYNEEKYGLAYARNQRMQQQNEKYKKAFMKDEDNIAKYKDLSARIDGNVDYKDLMSRAYDYQSAGVTDDGMIENGLKMEENHKEVSHEQMINVMQAASKRSEADFMDDKKREAMETNIKAKVGEEQGQKIMDLTAEAYGKTEFYEKKKQQRVVAAQEKAAKEQQAAQEKAAKERQAAQREAAKEKSTQDLIDALNANTASRTNKRGKR